MIDSQSLNLAQQRIQALRNILPDVFSENKIDWERLRQALGEEVFVKNEHYELNWAGKADARREVQRTTTATLVPDRSASIDFDQSDNVFIEGENLEVLRVLQRSYFGRVKLIYIDPPYNTGDDSFIYPDDYAERLSEYRQRSGKTDDEGFLNKQDLWHQNRRENGQFHSAWLSMMYPRLFIARNFLREDGVIFISIDDNELNNLRAILDEIFGEENFVGSIQWQKRTSPDARLILSTAHDSILVYTKNKDYVQDSFNYLPFDDSRLNDYKNPDNDPRKEWASRDITGQSGHATASQFYTITTPSGISYSPPDGRCWAISEETFKSLLADNRIWFGKNGDSRPRLKLFLSESKGKTSWTWWDNKGVGHSQEATKELNELNLADISGSINPKPIRLLKRILQLASHPHTGDIILDFFAGSATTAQAVMELNAEDGGNRSFILVQLPELIDSKSEVYKTGYRTIADISRERIRRAIHKINSQTEELAKTMRALHDKIADRVSEIDKLKSGTDTELFGNTKSTKAIQRLIDETTNLEDKLADIRAQYTRFKQTDIDFRAYHLAPSNFNVWQNQETNKQAIEQLLLNFTQSDKLDASSEQLLTEFMLKTGYPLHTRVEVLDLAGVPAYSVAEGRLLVLLDGYNEAINALIWKTRPKQVVCLDRLFAGKDEVLANLHLELRDRGIELSVI